MLWLWQTWACVWREVWVQRVCRYYLASLLEIALVALMFKDIASERPALLPGTHLIPRESSQNGEVATVETLLHRKARLVAYWPASNRTDALVTAAFPYGSFDNQSRWRLVPVTSREELLDVCAREIFDEGAKEEIIRSQSAVACVQFEPEDPGSWASLNYTVTIIANYVPTLGISWPQPDDPWKGLLSVPRYLQYMQEKLDMAHIALIRNNTTGAPQQDCESYAKKFPGPVLPEDVPNYRNGVLRILALAFALPFCLRVCIIVWESTSGLKETMNVMGLHDLAYWLAHWCSSVITGCAASIVVVVMMLTVVGISDDDESEGAALRHMRKAYLSGASPILLAVAFVIFTCSYSMHALFIASLSVNMTLALVMAALYWFVILAVVPWLSMDKYHASMADYIYTRKSSKLLSSVSPCMSLYWVLKIIGIATDVEEPAGFTLISHHVMGLDNVTISEIWIVTLITCLFLAVIVWYATRLLPFAATLPQPYGFPLKASYWLPRKEVLNLAEAGKESANIEKYPVASEPVLVVKDLKKAGNNAMTLDSVDLRLFDGEIDVILGPKGAGKSTLMNVVMGLEAPTEGRVVVCGYDITKYPYYARENVGYCLQRDVFFRDLTVLEHLEFYAMLKGMSYAALKARTLLLLELMELLSSFKSFPSNLSSGMRRRLSVCMAAISGPKVLVLDEPTRGSESEYRWDMWTVLMKMREECGILVATSDVEEAVVLANRITMLAQGRVVCSGSQAFLNKFYGTGYQVGIVNDKGNISTNQVLALIRQAVPQAEVAKHTTNELLISLKTTDTNGFQGMFKTLEDRSASLGITNIRVIAVTLEDSFAKMDRGGVDLSDPIKVLKQKEPDMEAVSKPPPWQPSCLQRLLVLLGKRRRYYTRRPSQLLLGVVAPLLIFWGQLQLESTSLGIVKGSLLGKEPPLRVNVGLSELYPEGSTFVSFDEQTREFAENYYLPLLKAESTNVITLAEGEDPDNFLREVQETVGLVQYTMSYVCGAAILSGTDKTNVENATTRRNGRRRSRRLGSLRTNTQGHFWRVESWWNPYIALSQVISSNLLHSALLRYYSGDPNARITFGALGHPTIDDDRRLRFQIGMDNAEISVPRTYRILLVPMGAAFLAASFALFPVWDTVSHAKKLQLMTGLPSTLYWLANLIFDLFIYTIVCTFTSCLYLWYLVLQEETRVYIMVVMASFAGLAINTAYLVTFHVKTTTVAYAFLVLFFSFGGVMTTFPYLLFLRYWIQNSDPPMWVRVPMVLLPSFPFPWAMLKLLQIDTENQHCLNYAQWTYGEELYLNAYCSDASLALTGSLALQRCCSVHNRTGSTEDLTSDMLSFSESGIALELSAMIFEGLVLFVVVCWMDTVTASKASVHLIDPPTTEPDTEVRKEQQLVKKIYSQRVYKGYSLIVRDICKSYGTVQALKAFTCAVKTNECFGILGMDGAGKTTACHVLSGFLLPVKGDAEMDAITLCNNPDQWQPNVGYCMQEGGLLDAMTGYEMLDLFARLRGLPGNSVHQIVISTLKLLELLPLAEVRCQEYSLENKRKLCLGCALIGMPKLLILDEPFNGMGTASLKSIRARLQSIKALAGISIIVTSDSIAVCSAICDRMSILAEGEMLCLGGAQHLAQKYTQGYTLTFGLTSELEPRQLVVREAIRQVFPSICFTEFSKNCLEYRLEEKQPLSQLFGRVAELSAKFNFQQVLVSETSLERIFHRACKRRPPDRPPTVTAHRLSLLPSTLPSSLHPSITRLSSKPIKDN